jgi:wyosine [tRNA(Phe)-imidazoG37] synthetase (radical SAM superfamily)
MADICIRKFGFVTEEMLKSCSFSKVILTHDTPVLNADGKPVFILSHGYNENNAGSYYCKVLSGLSAYNFSVNADMTVSCRCALRKSGLLGDLKEQTFEQIFNSEFVNSIRLDLRDGIHYNDECKFCSELCEVPRSISDYYCKNYSVPTAVMFENTSACNYKCKYCVHNDDSAVRHTVTMKDVENFAQNCKDSNIETIHFFKFGEPFLDHKVLEEIKLIRNYLPDVTMTTSTNGSLIDTPEKIEAALDIDFFNVSLDGINNEMLSLYQRGSQFDKVLQNLKNLSNARKASTNARMKSFLIRYVMFAWNDSDDSIERIFQICQELRCDSVQFVRGTYFRSFDQRIPLSTKIFDGDIFRKYMDKHKFSLNHSRYDTSLAFDFEY